MKISKQLIHLLHSPEKVQTQSTNAAHSGQPVTQSYILFATSNVQFRLYDIQQVTDGATLLFLCLTQATFIFLQRVQVADQNNNKSQFQSDIGKCLTNINLQNKTITNNKLELSRFKPRH
jgi:hypothetical protein